MKSKRKVRKLFYDINMSAPIVVDFKNQIKEGPFYNCVICNCCLYKISVIFFKKENYDDVNEILTSLVKSYDDLLYVCKTCNKVMKKKFIPCQAVSNKLDNTFLPKEFKSIHKLERVLVSRRIFFKKVVIMPKGKLPKIKGSLCNIPVNEVHDNYRSLPRPADSNGLLIVKLKRKAQYRSHVLFEPVRPVFVERFLKYLKNHSHLYSDIEINMDNLPSDLLDLNNGLNNDNNDDDSSSGSSMILDLLRCQNEPISIALEISEEGGLDDPLAQFKSVSDETTFISEIPTATDIEEAIVVAPGEEKQPVSLLGDEFCEELAHPHLFPSGKFGYKAEREMPLSPSRCFNQRLLNYSRKFTSDSNHIFFSHSVLQKLQLNSQIDIIMRKVAFGTLTAGMVSKNFKENVKKFIARDKGYSFMNVIKGAPAYWKKFLYGVLAMVKQLVMPTFFLTLSCADLRWNELISIISKLNGLNISDEDINQMPYLERCDTPALAVRHFQYTVEIFLKHYT